MLTRLLVLWLLSEQPHHGYRIQRILSDSAMAFWFPTDVASIYSCLRTLSKRQLVAEHSVEQEGKRPPRTVYRITPEGRAELVRLLERGWSQLPTPASPFQAALAGRAELPDARVADLLRERARALRGRLRQLTELERSAPDKAMVDRQRALTEAELDWLLRYVREEFPDLRIEEDET